MHSLDALHQGSFAKALVKFSYRPIPKWSKMPNVHPATAMLCATHPQFYEDAGDAQRVAQFRLTIAV